MLGIAAGHRVRAREAQGQRHGVRRADRRLGTAVGEVERRAARADAARVPLQRRRRDVHPGQHEPRRRRHDSRHRRSRRARTIDSLLAPQFAIGRRAGRRRASSTRIKHPAQVQSGAAYSGFKNWLLEADYSWVGWNSFKDLPVEFAGPAKASSRVLIEDYNNSSAIRLGAEYTIPSDLWKLRAGFVGAPSAAPAETVTPLLPEQDRNYWTLGLGVPFAKKWTVDAAYAHVSTPGARGRIAERVSESQTAAQLNTGVFHLSANIFSLTAQGQLLTDQETTDVTHASWQSAARSCSARPPSCSPATATRTFSARARQPAVQQLRRDRQQHHRGLPVGRDQRFHAAAVVRRSLLAKQMGTRYGVRRRCSMPGCRPPINNFQTQTRVTLPGQPASTATTCALRSPKLGDHQPEQRRCSGHHRRRSDRDPSARARSVLTRSSFWAAKRWSRRRSTRARPSPPSGSETTMCCSFAVTRPAGRGDEPGHLRGELLEDDRTSSSPAPRTSKGVLIGVVQVANAPVMFTSQALLNPRSSRACHAAAGKPITVDPTTCTPTNTSLIGIPIIAQIRAGALPPIIACAKTPTPPIGDIFVLDAAEQVQVKGIIDGYNAYIKAKADSIGFAYYDPNTTLARLATIDAVLGQPRPESREPDCDIWAVRQSWMEFIRSRRAHVQIANDLITVINAKYGTHLAAVVPDVR